MMRFLYNLAFLLAIGTAKGQDSNQLKIRPGDSVSDSVFQYILDKTGRTLNTPGLFILDFWSTSCSSCIAAFPKVDSLQKHFGEEVQFVLVNSNESQQKIDTHFQLMNKRRKAHDRPPINLPEVSSIVGDDFLRTVFPYVTVPHHVWVSDKGEVVAITSGTNSNISTIQDYLNGQKIELAEKKEFTSMDTNHPLFLSKDADRNQIEHYSLLIKRHAGYFRRPTSQDKNRFFAMNRTLRILYESIADRLVPRLRHGRLVFEVDDHVIQDSTYYTYDFIVPESLSDSLYHYALQDLNRYMPVIGQVEKRKISAFVLKFSGDTDAFQAKSAEPKNTLYLRAGRSVESQKLINRPWENFLAWVSSTARQLDSDPVLVDETGISENIDIIFSETINDLPSLRRQLKSFGFQLVEEEREVEVFVIKQKSEARR